MHTRILLAGGLVGAFLIGGLVEGQGGDWPQWRGPNRDGKSSDTGLLAEWPSDGPTLVWKTNGIGGGFSSVAVVDGKVFTLGDGADSSFLHALDVNGKHLWMAKVGRIGGGGGYPGPRCTPAVNDGMVYGLGQYGDLVCVEAASGKEVWHKNMRKDFNGRVGGWGYSESPLVDNDQVICAPGGMDGAMVALNKKTGEIIWRCKDFKDNAEYSSTIVEEVGGVRQYIQFTGASVAGVAAKDGKLLWRAARQGRTATIPTPVYHDDCVYVASGYGVGCNLFKITPGDTFTVEEVYANKTMVNHHGGVILVGENVYGYSDGKGWVCQKFKTGEMVWSDKKLGKGSISFADGHFYLRSEDSGAVVLIDASPEAYKEKGRLRQPDRSSAKAWPHPVIAGGKLYLRDQDLLFCYDVKQK